MCLFLPFYPGTLRQVVYMCLQYGDNSVLGAAAANPPAVLKTGKRYYV